MYISWLGWCLVNSAQNQVGPIHSREVSGLVPGGGGGGGHSTFFQVGVCGPDFRSVGSGVDPGGMGGYIPPIFDQGGMAYVIIPPPNVMHIW